MLRIYRVLVGVSVLAACAHRPETNNLAYAVPSDSAWAAARTCATGLLQDGGYEVRSKAHALAGLSGRRQGAILTVDPPTQAIDEVMVTFSRQAPSSPVHVEATPTSYVLHEASWRRPAYLTLASLLSSDAQHMAQQIRRNCSQTSQGT